MALEYATSLNNLRLEQYFDISSSDMLITAALVGDSRRPGGGRKETRKSHDRRSLEQTIINWTIALVAAGIPAYTAIRLAKAINIGALANVVIQWANGNIP